MTRLTLMTSLLLVSAMGGCSAPPPRSSASAAARTACRNYADEVFAKQNRDAVYRSDSYSTGLRDSPFGSSGMPGLPTTGLSQQFGVETTEQNCLNGTGSGPVATDSGARALTTGK